MRTSWMGLLLMSIGCSDRLEPPKPERTDTSRPVPVDPMRLLDEMRDAQKPDRVTSPLPESGPHPDYPTPVASGTDKIFTLEDPDRGAKVPIAYALPAPGSLTWTTHVHCDAGAVGIACLPGTGFKRWRVGRRGKELVVAESWIGTRVVQRYVYVSRPDGTPIRRVELDMFGRVAEMLTFTAAHRYAARRPSGSNGLRGCGSMEVTVGKSGLVSELRCLQWTGQPMRDTRGVATSRIERDPRGFVIAHHYFGLDDRPVANIDGFATVRYERDNAGRIATRRYHDAAGKPVVAADGCHGWRSEYDARGLEVRTICLDATGGAQASAGGVAVETNRYDARGCLVAVRYTAADGQPATDRDNVHGIDLEADGKCQQTGRTCVNVVEQPIACGPEQPARTSGTYDKVGNLVSMKHYDADGAPGGDGRLGVFELRWQYDDLGREIGESCYGDKGAPVEGSNTGYHAQKQRYDEAGRAVEHRFFDLKGAPGANLGIAYQRSRYDSYDHVYETVDYDGKGELVETAGMTTRRVLYDTAHRQFAILLLDKAGRPANYTACYAGARCPGQPWHAVRLVRGQDGHVSQNQFFDATGQLILTHDCRKVPCFD